MRILARSKWGTSKLNRQPAWPRSHAGRVVLAPPRGRLAYHYLPQWPGPHRPQCGEDGDHIITRPRPPIVSHAGERSPMCGRSWHAAAEPRHASVGWPAASTAPPPPGLVLQHACFKMKALVHCTCPSSIKRRSRSLARAHTPAVLHGRRHCELELP
jgi:hypothetical protein